SRGVSVSGCARTDGKRDASLSSQTPVFVGFELCPRFIYFTQMTEKFTISIIGVGRLGGALAIALDRKKITIENLFARNHVTAVKVAKIIESNPQVKSADDFSGLTSDVILITTQDSEIENVADRLLKTLKTAPQIFHTSGALSSKILNKLKTNGCRVGSIHPLISISDAVLGADKFADAYFCVEGDDEAIITAKKIVGELGGKPFSVAGEYKTLYHASAVTACGHLVALIDAAIEMLNGCGLNESEARKVLLPLIKSTVENLAGQTTAEALTGTFARADIETFSRHLSVLRDNVSPETLEIYLQLGARSLNLAEARGANKGNLEKIRGQILLAKKNLK
ncbi:MAG: DUF2520 domain-containing protein, partial [Pyrinomonadaceae bacterium]|nr:DUF2520 domain-containing protein [Pyrinomonadaceae bacterium]